MFLVCPDANTLYSDPLLLNTLSQRLLWHVEKGTCEVHLSPVVVAELDRRLRDQLGAEHDSFIARVDKMGRQHQKPVGALLAELEKFRSTVSEQIDVRREEFAGLAGYFVQHWPSHDVQAIVERELARKRPFIDKEKAGTIGHRDTIIWLGVLALADSHPDDTILFVTQDKGFLGDDGFHKDLQEDLTSLNIAVDRVLRLRDLYSVVNILDKQLENDQRRAAIRQALHDYNDVLAKMQWGSEEFDPRGNDIEPDIDAELPGAMLTVLVGDIETLADPVIELDTCQIDEPIFCTHQVAISFMGDMEKGNWYIDDYPGVELWDDDLNDHYVSVDAYRVLELTTQVIYDPDTDKAHVDELLNARVVALGYETQ